VRYFKSKVLYHTQQYVTNSGSTKPDFTVAILFSCNVGMDVYNRNRIFITAPHTSMIQNITNDDDELLTVVPISGLISNYCPECCFFDATEYFFFD
jgi:hypothetical protein